MSANTVPAVIRNAFTQSRFSRGCQVLGCNDLQVMRDLARREIRQRAHAEWIVTRDASPIPCLGWQTREQRQRCVPDRCEFIDKTLPRPIVEPARRDGDVLVEARKRRVEAARKPEGA